MVVSANDGGAGRVTADRRRGLVGRGTGTAPAGSARHGRQRRQGVAGHRRSTPPSRRCPRARADLGAIQNRFDHTINNLNVAVENLTASESRIRDTDMAQEMVQFTRNQILSQAGTAMLAQANQASQGIL